MFISLSSTCIQNFSNWHALFVLFFFLSHAVAVAAWSGIQLVAPQMIHLELFLSPGVQEPVQLPNNICLVQAAKKIYFRHSHRKDNHPGPLPQQGFCTSLKIGDELGVTWQTKQRVFLPSQGPLILNFFFFHTHTILYLIHIILPSPPANSKSQTRRAERKGYR